jgi:lipid A 3-O-deacylase
LRLIVAILVWAYTAAVFSSSLAPESLFAQAGVGDQHTDALVVGGVWDGPWHEQLRWGAISGYFEMDVGRWSTRTAGSTSAAWPTQLGATPVLRFAHTPDPAWFCELGVGANYIVPLFRSGKKRFSTEFNFGDHVGIGRRLGSAHRLELALRAEHFSNAGISHPNPGENFLQIRLSVHR